MRDTLCCWCEKLFDFNETSTVGGFTLCKEHFEQFHKDQWISFLCTSSELSLSSIISFHDKLKRENIPVLIETNYSLIENKNVINSQMHFWIKCKDLKEVLARLKQA